MRPPIRPSARWPGGRTGRLGSLVGIVGLGLLLSASPSMIGSAAAYSGPTPELTWDNGRVRCDFASAQPVVAVSALDLPDSGLSATVPSVAEYSPLGSEVALARLGGTTWHRTNASNEDLYDMAYTAHVGLASPNGTPLSGGADVRVDYTLVSYPGPGATNLSSVTWDLAVSNWTGQSPSDHLVLNLSAWPSFVANERLTSTSDGTGIVSVSRASGSAREYLIPFRTIELLSPGGSNVSAPVSPVLELNDSLASVEVAAPAANGTVTGLRYSATIWIPVPAMVAGLPLYAYALVGSAAVAASLAVAAMTRRVRRRPSRLAFVEEGP